MAAFSDILNLEAVGRVFPFPLLFKCVVEIIDKLKQTLIIRYDIL